MAERDDAMDAAREDRLASRSRAGKDFDSVVPAKYPDRDRAATVGGVRQPVAHRRLGAAARREADGEEHTETRSSDSTDGWHVHSHRGAEAPERQAIAWCGVTPDVGGDVEARRRGPV
jgi:hypothetical protein